MLGIASVGDNTIDCYLDSGQRFVGGNALNVAVHLAALGVRSVYAGGVGTDRFGDLTVEALANEGVSTAYLVRLHGRTSYSTISLDDNGDRKFIEEYFGVCDDYFPGLSTVDAISAMDWVHIGMLRDAMTLRQILAERGCRISQDCAVSDGFDNLEVAFCSRDGGAEEDALALAETAIKGGSKLAVVTRGVFGSIAFDGTNLWRQHAIPVTVVDTTGAGDTFIAAFLASYADDRRIADCLQSAAIAAARTCTHRGGWQQDLLSK